MDKICVVGGYQLDLYCKRCNNDLSVGGFNKGKAVAEAKRHGWSVNFAKRTALCPAHRGNRKEQDKHAE